MKKVIVLGIFCLAVSAIYFSCSHAKAEKIDVARDITPVVTPTREVVRLVDQLRQANPSQRSEILSQNEWLNQQLIMHALQNQYITAAQARRIDTVVYYYGSADAQAKDKSGKLFDGKITDELVGFIYVKGIKKPIGIIVYCTNGTFGPLLENLKRIGTLPLVFTIQKGNGANRYVDYRTSIWLADIFGRVLHQGQGWGGKVLTPDEAYALSDRLREIGVTMEVYPDDVFNLGNMTYTHNGKVTHAKLR